MLPVASGLLKRSAARMLDQTATVYARDSAGKYTVVATTGLKCLLQPLNREAAPTSSERVDLANGATFYWDAAYDLVETAQIEVSAYPGTRWNVRAGTLWGDVAPGQVVLMRHCDVVRA